MTIDITERLEWLNKRLGLSEIHKEYIGFQMKELALEVKQKTEQELKSDLLNPVIDCSHEWKADTFDNIDMALTEYCEECGAKRDCR